jgi:4-coumarate--CoA ligase
LTETSPISHYTPRSEAPGRQSKIGRLIPTFRARLVDPESHQDVEVGQAGELWLQSPSVMKGYYNNPEATKNTFSSPNEEGGRWFKTGDSAWVDEEGYFQIADRLKELIKYKGFQGEFQS